MADLTDAEGIVKHATTAGELRRALAICEQFLELGRVYAAQLPDGEGMFGTSLFAGPNNRQAAEETIDEVGIVIAYVNAFGALDGGDDEPVNPQALTSGRKAVRLTQELLDTIRVAAEKATGRNLVADFIRSIGEVIKFGADTGADAIKYTLDKGGEVAAKGAQKLKDLLGELWPVLAVVGGVAAAVGIGYVFVRARA